MIKEICEKNFTLPVYVSKVESWFCLYFFKIYFKLMSFLEILIKFKFLQSKTKFEIFERCQAFF